jgi:LacI family transcriptional regulator
MEVPQSSSASPLTIYDVARHAGVSIASVSRVLNGLDSPRPETRERVMAAVRELDFVPDGAARALSSRLKEVVGVYEAGRQPRVASMAGKSDGLILHDKVLGPEGIIRLSRRIPIVTLVGTPTPNSVNVRSDNAAGMRELTAHLIADHNYSSIGYVAGHADSPDNIDRAQAGMTLAAEAGVEFRTGPRWQGNYMASGGAKVIDELVAADEQLPEVIMCANDQTAIGVLYALAEHGISVPDDVAVTGFDDIPVARHLRPRLTTVRQPIQQLGATAFELVYGLISGEQPAQREVVLPTTLIRRRSCGCPGESA